MSISKSFIWRKQILEDGSLRSTTKLVAMMLHYHMDNHTCECFPSEATIAQEASLTERCVVAHIKKLRQKFYIHIRKEKGGQGWNRNCYRGILRPEYHSESIKEEGEFETKGSEYKDQKVVNEIQINSSLNSSFNSIKDVYKNQYLNKLWNEYPEYRRDNYEKCDFIWKQKQLNSLTEIVLKGFYKAKNSKQWDEGYIPNISKFIDEEHWKRQYQPRKRYDWEGAL